MFIGAESVLVNHNHPIYKPPILLDGIVFSKTDFSRALKQFPTLRDYVIENLCKEGVCIKSEVFAKKASGGIIEYLEGYIKRSPAIDENAPLNVEDCINFGSMREKYGIFLEENTNSFNNKQSFMENSEHKSVKHILNRSDIKLTSYLFSTKFFEFINQNTYFSERFAIDNDAICFDKPSIIPTTSNIGNLYFIDMPNKTTIVNICHFSMLQLLMNIKKINTDEQDSVKYQKSVLIIIFKIMLDYHVKLLAVDHK